MPIEPLVTQELRRTVSAWLGKKKKKKKKQLHTFEFTAIIKIVPELKPTSNKNHAFALSCNLSREIYITIVVASQEQPNTEHTRTINARE